MTERDTGEKQAGQADSPFVLAFVGAALLPALVLTAAWEWEHYRRLLQWSALPIIVWDRVVLFWLLWAKSLWLLTPLVFATLVVRGFSTARAAWAVWWLSATAVFFWLAIDLRVQAVTGNHLLTYLDFVFDPTTWRWAGGLSGLVLPALALLGLVAAGVGLTSLVAHWTTRYWAGRLPWLKRRPGQCLALSALLVAAAGVVLAERFVTVPLVFERLRAVLVFDPVCLGGGPGESNNLERFRIELNRGLSALYGDCHRDVMTPRPADGQAQLTANSPPNVILLVLESFRHDVVSPHVMPRLHALAKRGLRFERHYAGSNCSHLGLYCLLYARNPLTYHPTLDARVAPQGCVTFRASNYDLTYLSSSTVRWCRMEAYINDSVFDRLVIEDHDDWPNDDCRVLEQVAQLAATSERPQFIVAFLMSTHFPYAYPPSCQQHEPVMPPEEVVGAGKSSRPLLWNRYRNAAGFLDRELHRLLGKLDLRNNLVVVTGDHGEALFDDGSASHWSKLSEIQTRVPLILCGKGVEPGAIREATTHADVLPTVWHIIQGRELELQHCHGRDMLAGPHGDQALLATQSGKSPYWHALLIRGSERLNLRIATDRPSMHAQGFVDPIANLDPLQSPDPKEVITWSRSLGDELRRLRR